MIYASYEGRQLECRFKYEQGQDRAVIKNGMAAYKGWVGKGCPWMRHGYCCALFATVAGNAFAAVTSFVWLQLDGQINARSRQSRTMAVLILRVQPEKSHGKGQCMQGAEDESLKSSYVFC